MGFAAITGAWNGAVLASRFGDCGSLIVFGGGHNDYFGSDVHAFDSRRASGGEFPMGSLAASLTITVPVRSTPTQSTPTARRCRRTPKITCSTTRSATTT
jgi:hypothetical protein